MLLNKFNKSEFKLTVEDNVKRLYRKTIEEATQQQLFQAVSYAIKDTIMDGWLETQSTYKKEDPKSLLPLNYKYPIYGTKAP